MRTGKRHLIRVAAIVLASLAIVPAAQASGTSPDDRAYPRSVSAAIVPASVSPDDRPLARETSVSVATRIVSPDDRAYARDNSVSTPTRTVSPDDRAFSRAVRTSRLLQTPRPIHPHRFDRGDALIGGTLGLALAALAAGAVALFIRRRTLLRAA